MLLNGDLSGQLLLLATFDSSNFAMRQNSEDKEMCFGFLGAKKSK